MKRIQVILIVIVVFSVFLLSFLIGRATALKEKNDEKINDEVYNTNIRSNFSFKPEEEQTAPASAFEPKAEKDSSEPVVSEKEEPKPVAEEPPLQMLFPCGKVVVNDYSQSAVYSKTMGDWRAHTGIDYAAETGTPVISVWDGVVSSVYKDKLWGYCIEIVHTGNVKGVYKNLDSDILIHEGDKVSRGQAIAKVGESAPVEKREESHLHFEMWVDGNTINPQSYVY